MMRTGVISDTHGLLRPEVLEALAGVEHIIHAGDIGSPDIVPRLAEISPVTAIHGNVDVQPCVQAFPAWEVVTLAGRVIYVIHDVGDLDLDPAAAGIAVVCTATHPRLSPRPGRRGLPQSRQRGSTAVQVADLTSTKEGLKGAT